jgi:predicted nucleic acid-binding protein
MSLSGRRGVPDRLPLIYADSCVYLDLITRNTDPHKVTEEPRWRSASSLFGAMDRGVAKLAASPLVEAEVLCNGNTQQRQARSERVADLLRGWFTSPNVLWVDVDRLIAREAARLTVDYGDLRAGERRMSAADAMHLAAALRARCDYFMTHDEGFPLGQVIEGVHVIRPEAVWQETLFDA